MGIGSELRVKRPGHGVDHPPPSSAEVKERVALYIYSPSGLSWPVLGWPLPLASYIDLQSIQLHSKHISQYSLNKYQLMEWSGFYFSTYFSLFPILNYLFVTQYHNYIHYNHKNMDHFLVLLYTLIYLHFILAWYIKSLAQNGSHRCCCKCFEIYLLRFPLSAFQVLQ